LRPPLIYAAIILIEIVYLGWRYRLAAPRSSDPFSIWLGWFGLAAMIVMLVYSIARRSRALRDVARLSHWLHLHIFLGLFGVVAVLFHSLHVLKKIAAGALNPLNPGFLCLVAVLVVFCSGIYGRYMYSLLPRRKSGEQMAAQEVEREIESMQAQLPEEVKALWRDAKRATTFAGLIAADLATRRALRRLAGFPLAADQRALAERRVRLERRLAAYDAADTIFRRWIVLHRPIAAVMYVISAVHVILSYMFTPMR
jgi:hypothetical protein